MLIIDNLSAVLLKKNVILPIVHPLFLFHYMVAKYREHSGDSELVQQAVAGMQQLADTTNNELHKYMLRHLKKDSLSADFVLAINRYFN